MTNYDYNKGYRGFRFRKDNKIDQKLPALTTYVSVRQSSSMHWISSINKQRFLQQENALTPRKEPLENNDVTDSIVYFPRIGSTIGGQAVSTNKCFHDEDSMEGFLERYSLAPVNTAATLSIRGASVLESPLGPKTPYKLPRSEIKSRKQKKRTPRSRGQSNKDLEVYKRDQKLKECLVIHNGVERAGRGDLLTQEKSEDIKEWIDKMPS